MKNVKKFGAYLILFSCLLGSFYRTQAMEEDALQSEHMEEDDHNIEQIARQLVGFIHQSNLIKVIGLLFSLQPEQRFSVINYRIQQQNNADEQKTALQYAIEKACPTIVAVLRNAGAQSDQEDLESRALQLKGRAQARILQSLRNVVPHIHAIDDESLKELAQELLARAQSNKLNTRDPSEIRLWAALAQLSETQRDKVFNVQDNLGGSLLFYALIYQNSDLVGALLDRGARSSQGSPIPNETLLRYALELFYPHTSESNEWIIAYTKNAFIGIKNDDYLKNVQPVVAKLLRASFTPKDKLSSYQVVEEWSKTRPKSSAYVKPGAIKARFYELAHYIEQHKLSEFIALFNSLTPSAKRQVIKERKGLRGTGKSLLSLAIHNLQPLMVAILLNSNSSLKNGDITYIDNLIVQEAQHTSSKMKLEVIQVIKHVIELSRQKKGQPQQKVVSDLPPGLQPVAQMLLDEAKELRADSEISNQLSQDILNKLNKLPKEQRESVINIHDTIGGSALFYAVLHQNVDVVRQLLALGSHSLVSDPTYCAPILTYALTVLVTMDLNNEIEMAVQNQFAICSLLVADALEKTASVDKPKLLDLIKHVLNLAELARSETIGASLIQTTLTMAGNIQRTLGIPLQAQELDLADVLHRAIRGPDGYRHEFVKVLLESDWKQEIVNSPDADGHTPLQYAKTLPNAPLFWLLVASGAAGTFGAYGDTVPENRWQAAIQQLRANPAEHQQLFAIPNPFRVLAPLGTFL
jgi:ankyrin repeat protein